MNLISRARPENATPETPELLQEITLICKTRQRFEPRSGSFQVTTMDGIVFNHESAFDLMSLDRISVLNVGDAQIYFAKVVFLYSRELCGPFA